MAMWISKETAAVRLQLLLDLDDGHLDSKSKLNPQFTKRQAANIFLKAAKSDGKSDVLWHLTAKNIKREFGIE